MPTGNQTQSKILHRVFYRPELVRVVRTRRMTEVETLLELQRPDGQPLGHGPGQFVQVSVFGYGEAPISLCSSPTLPGSFEICVRAVGSVSRAIHHLSPGDWVGIRGPYGNGFPVEQMKDRDILIVAGGIGLAPIRSLIQFVNHNRRDYRRVIVVYGARNPAAILFKEDIDAWAASPGIEFYVTVDQPTDSWKGRTGVLTGPVKEISFDSDAPPIVAACGPPVMYKFLAWELLAKGIPQDRIFFSLERRFECGIGKCGHCQLNDLYVCQDGPVFSYSQLVGRTEAIEAWAADSDQDSPRKGGSKG